MQGSYARGEATETSDIDIVVILDELSAMDIQNYNAMLDTLSNRELICGFLPGKDDIMNWEPSDLFQFCHDTTPIKGSLDEVMAIVYKQTGSYIKHQEELLTVATLNEQAIINTFLSLKKGGSVDFIPMSEALFVWAKQWIS